ncbi:galectin-3-binding protein A-like [Lampris incognitus]|uniref:galectin-3-binding protein A-like n=1 Tax=Lampris incognitus TaxID=2546036 RepID=UPI0024B4B667|nr:galectin-3-binding protein A-like [Lampris incognitus]XP_056144549.1 galectin-3-binding protein A-like [Lampris incognitus]
MRIQGILYTLMLALLHISGNASMKFNLLFTRAKTKAQNREGDVRLAGSPSLSEGRVEIYHDGKWGTVCDDSWDLAEAQVVCRQLGFPAAKSTAAGGAYGEGSGPIWLDDMNCEGTENFLSSCTFKGWAITDCTHKEDVGIVCKTGLEMTLNVSKHSLDHSLGLSEELGQLFDSRDSCDFVIRVQTPTGNIQYDGTEEMEGTTLCTHKMILSRFPHFNTSVETDSISVTVSQTCQPVFSSFIRYIYTRKVDVTVSSARCLHQFASDFGVKQLMEDTGRLFTKLLPDDVTFHTQVSLYKYAMETGDLLLQENSLQYLAWNYQNLTGSPAWSHLPMGLLKTLLSRSDLVVPDESFLLLSLESWITEKGNSTSLENQADLLGHIRFPMIPAEKLYDLEFTSTLYKTHESLYHKKILKGFQFNVVLNSVMNKSTLIEDDYQPRIYTGELWSTAFDSVNIDKTQRNLPQSEPTPSTRYNQYDYYYYRQHGYMMYSTVSPYQRSRTTKSFSTPVHNSMIFQENKIHWEADVFASQRDCSNRGITCESLPAARLTAQNSLSKYQGRVHFSNRLLLICEGKFICQVQDFKNDLAHISSDSLSYPCPNDQFTYLFVVRPTYS